MEIYNHWLNKAQVSPSPNHDLRPVEDDISLIVIHCISLPPGEFENGCISDFFSNQLETGRHTYFEEICHLKVSAHTLITRSGNIIQYVPFNKRAWHAGDSMFKGRCACNDFSIGIELEGTETLPYTDQQYTKLANLIHCLLLQYPKLSKDRIAGHSDIAPGRKKDPGESFDWSRLQKDLNVFSKKITIYHCSHKNCSE